MGNKYISIILVLVLLTSSIVTVFSASSLGLPIEGQPLGARTQDKDNGISTATQLYNRSKIQGTVDTNDDERDFFKVNLRRMGRNGDILRIDLKVNQTMGAIAMLLVNPQMYSIGDSLCYETPWDSDNPIDRTIIACTSGFYYIVLVALFAGAGTSIKYDLEVHYHLIGNRTDNDNTNATAATAISGGSYTKSINPVNDYLDLYEIDLVAGSPTTEGLIVELLNTTDKYLAVYNPDGSLRERSDIIGGDPFDKEIIKFAADTTGTYRIAVGTSGHPRQPISYILNTTVLSGVPPDDDHDEGNATRVYDGTKLDSSFNSELDELDYYVMELDSNDNLTVSILFTDNTTDLDIVIYEEFEWWPINYYIYYEGDEGLWTWGIAEMDQTDYYIKVENFETSNLVNYTIWFSLSGENVLFQDEPMSRNSTNLDFSMPEDTVDTSHVNLSHIFFDPDSAITFASPSHFIGSNNNISVEILANSTIKFTPDENYNGYEIVNFSATDINSEVLYWEVNVTVSPVNDAPILTDITNQLWTQGAKVNLSIVITDVDNTEFSITDNTTLFDVDQLNRTIEFTPTNAQVGSYQINITVSDGEINVSDHFIAEIQNINDPPKFIRIGGKNPVPGGVITFQATEDTWNNYTVEVSDIDHDIGVMDVLTFMDTSVDNSFKIDPATGNISFFPLQEHVDSKYFNVTITVNDGNNGTDKQNLSFEVQNVNDAPGKPEINLQNISDLSISCSVDEVLDEDGDNLMYSWDFGDESGQVVLGLVGNHTYSEPGNYTVNITVSDGNGGLARDSMIVNVIGKIDGDGKNDSKDNDTNGKDKPFPDVDDDGLNDTWEMEQFGNLTYGPEDDVDNDGFTNLQEFENNTDPKKKTDRPITKKDDGEKDTDMRPFGEDKELLLYLVGILGIINLILIIVVIGFVVTRKKPKPMEAAAEQRTDRPAQDWFTVPCPECGREISEHARECPYCGEEIDLAERREDFGRGDRGAARRRRPHEDRDEEFEEAEWEPEEEEGEWEEEDEEYYDEDEGPYEEDEWVDEEEEEAEFEDEEEPYEERDWDEDEEYYEEDYDTEEEYEDEYVDEDEYPEEDYDEDYDDEYYDEDYDEDYDDEYR